ncbi:hypothetical protein [Adhaeribacter pallidiroseus]|uniref:Sugar phosphate isomerase/epimerase n=1 Tax=Adhaeribacter pallidiroseus TaxID=2072847 RepID=A0A369QFN0_9BACT|nr:hypothetical protein [Adhaeribacter pallidiroseus]RDC63723.1 hypothetical protein AHMF7616_02331 [Adhaeribacter pallidiroseus]
MQRRSFVKSVMLGATGISLNLNFGVTPAPRSLGVQLWNIREYLKKDLTGSLTKLAYLGYNPLELFGYDGTYWGKTPKEFSKTCTDLGFTIVSAHFETGRIDKAKGTLWYG